jgi:hypothetical protein
MTIVSWSAMIAALLLLLALLGPCLGDARNDAVD